MPELLFLWHPNTASVFSGYGLVVKPYVLVGLLAVDRSQPVSEDWLQQVRDLFGNYDFYPMIENLDHGINGNLGHGLACVMFVEPDSRQYLMHFDVAGLEDTMTRLLEKRPRPQFYVRWDDAQRLWTSRFKTVDVSIQDR
jgi:hypothetical protein